MRGPEEWPSRRSNPADRIRLTGPAAKNDLLFKNVDNWGIIPTVMLLLPTIGCKEVEEILVNFA
jgi:hypothetical protein